MTYEAVRLDGFGVDQFAGRFMGTFDMDENYPMEAEVTFVVVAKVAEPNFVKTKFGDLKRINKFEVVEVQVTDPGAVSIIRAAAQVDSQLELREEFFVLPEDVSEDDTLEELSTELEDEEFEEVFSPGSKGPAPRVTRDQALNRFLTEELR